jgi:NAD(P)-dependent dehydrogenase (short-subunit alcohol dehydrogenase family)
MEATAAAYGGIDILVNNVGGGGGGARIADSSDDDWRGALERNLIQTVRMMRLALPHMREAVLLCGARRRHRALNRRPEAAHAIEITPAYVVPLPLNGS